MWPFSAPKTYYRITGSTIDLSNEDYYPRTTLKLSNSIEVRLERVE